MKQIKNSKTVKATFTIKFSKKAGIDLKKHDVTVEVKEKSSLIEAIHILIDTISGQYNTSEFKIIDLVISNDQE